eukprot:maker-scaffold_2-snap-gene-11.50-mRNA-1 protein AED:0.01 eAED:0.01 QI:0/1/0.5/1/0/0/2/133/335
MSSLYIICPNKSSRSELYFTKQTENKPTHSMPNSFDQNQREKERETMMKTTHLNTQAVADVFSKGANNFEPYPAGDILETPGLQKQMSLASNPTTNDLHFPGTPLTPFGSIMHQFFPGTTPLTALGMSLASPLPQIPVQNGNSGVKEEIFQQKGVKEVGRLTATQSYPNMDVRYRFPTEEVGKKRRNSTPKKSMKRRRSSHSKVNDDTRWKSWTREEEVFLVGGVMNRFFKRGSLSSTRADDKSNDDCWSYIKNFYDKAWENYEAMGGIAKPTDRSVNALTRHYKVMKARICQADMNGNIVDDKGNVHKIEDFSGYFYEWQNKFNVNGKLVKNRE